MAFNMTYIICSIELLTLIGTRVLLCRSTTKDNVFVGCGGVINY